MSTTKSSKVPIGEVVNLQAVTADIDAGTFKLYLSAAKYGVSPAALKSFIITSLGSSVEFRRGRHGGVYRVTTTTQTASS